ncbi:MAG: helix-turn-helix domain-containing protein [Acidimicrobiia bacterium]
MNRDGGDEVPTQRRTEAPSITGLASVFANTDTEPAEGEIWRAAWGSSVQLVFVVEVRDDDFDAVPVNPDIDLIDDHAVVIGPGPPLTHPLAAWSGLRRALPIRALDVRVAAGQASDLAAVRRGRGQGAPITSLLDERAQVRDALASRLEDLASATWLPSISSTIDLGGLLRARNLSPSKLAPELGVAPGDVTAIARGDRTPSPEQAETLSRLLDVAPDQLLSAAVDTDLVWALDRPRVRRRLAERGVAEGEPDEAAWRLRVARTKLPTAARTTGTTDSRRRWTGLIETYLDER